MIYWVPHFVSRYIYQDNIFEADGMEHDLTDGTTNRLSAKRKYVTDDYEEGFSFILQNKNERNKQKQAHDVYHVKQQ